MSNLKLEVGKVYVTRDGRRNAKVLAPLDKDFSTPAGEFAVQLDDMLLRYNADGTQPFSGTDPEDLVREYKPPIEHVRWVICTYSGIHDSVHFDVWDHEPVGTIWLGTRKLIGIQRVVFPEQPE